MNNTEYEKTMLQQISDVAWLVHRGKESVGLLNKDVQEHFTFISGKEMVTFDGESQVREHFGNLSLFEEKIETPTQKQDAYYIRGYEVGYAEPFALEEDHDDYCPDLPLYTKIAGGTIYYAAGYYCINFEKSWKFANGPKLSTLEKYGFEGPYRLKADVQKRVKELNKAKKSV